jgi:hypothetical protein
MMQTSVDLNRLDTVMGQYGHAGTFVLAIVADYYRCVMLTFVSLGVRSRSQAGRQESVAPKAGPIRTVEAPRFDLILASKWRVFEISALPPARIRRSNRLNTLRFSDF